MTVAFVTGATGFVGANLCHRLLAEGYEVHIALRSQQNMWRLAAIQSELYCHQVDLLDGSRLTALLSEINPSVICHLATYGGVPGQSEAQKIIDTNLYGTINLLSALASVDFSVFINTGSSSEYGTKAAPMKETDVCEPVGVYGVAKAAATQYCQIQAQQMQRDIGTLRLFSPYGPMESPHRLFPSLMTSMLRGQAVKLAKPNAARDFSYIEDVLDAYLSVIRDPKPFAGQTFNICSGNQSTVAEVAELAKAICKTDAPLEYGQVSGRAQDTHYWVGDNSKFSQAYSWRPRFSLEQGVRATLAWFQDHLDHYSE